MITISRFVDYGTREEGTFGILSFRGFSCYTVECRWLDNMVAQSCIPPGHYSLERHNSPRFGECVIIFGNTVSKFPSPNHKRSYILIHPANFSYQLEGCIGLGDSFTIIDGLAAVSNSRKTVAEFLDLINIGETYDLHIDYSDGRT